MPALRLMSSLWGSPGGNGIKQEDEGDAGSLDSVPLPAAISALDGRASVASALVRVKRKLGDILAEASPSPSSGICPAL